MGNSDIEKVYLADAKNTNIKDYGIASCLPLGQR